MRLTHDRTGQRGCSNQRVITLAQELIALPSVNPMGRLSGDPAIYLGEVRVQDYLESCFRKLGAECESQEVLPGRSNIIARFKGRKPSETIFIDAHMDTVPVTGMTVDPFKGIIVGKRLYGRGACDVKGSLAALLAALDRIFNESRTPETNVIVAGTVDEEYMYSGIKRLLPSLKQHCITLAIVFEPTELAIGIRHKGLIEWRLSTVGRAAHGSTPQFGINAIYLMKPVLQALESFAIRLTDVSHNRPWDSPSLNVGVISGGQGVNTVPDYCEIEFEYRMPPGQNWLDVDNALRVHLDASGLSGLYKLASPHLIDPPMETSGTHAAVMSFHGLAKEVHPGAEKMSLPFGTNASKLTEIGIPTIVFGAGSIRQAHSENESVEIEQLCRAEDILYRLFREGLRCQ
jgi:acetylornithine deacetylase/succinyl-diaminopimelate desuccinylase-like protein